MEKIAIIGSGISGLTCGYLLNQHYDVHLFEANDYIGGHTATVDIKVHHQDYAIDTGFIVFNDKTYPNFIKLLTQLNVCYQPTEMSFSVQNKATGFEYNGHNVNSLFAQRRNIFSPTFWHFLYEIIKFNRLCKKVLQDSSHLDFTLDEFLAKNNFSDFFSTHYILPMCSAIWSSGINDAKDISLPFFIQFFNNHGLLNIIDRPQWYVLKGGSRSYISPLIAAFKHQINLSSSVTAVNRQNNQVNLQINANKWLTFDKVIFACHSNQALHMLTDLTSQESDILADIDYQQNEVVLHTDRNLLPLRRQAWASWNYLLGSVANKSSSVTYNMNILQGLDENCPLFLVSLNQTQHIDQNKILKKFTYSHPVFNQQSVLAQNRKQEICGKNNTYYAGAYWKNGFHEDGVNSALDVCKKLGVHL